VLPVVALEPVRADPPAALGGVDEAFAAGVDAHVGDRGAAAGGEEQQIALADPVQGHRLAPGVLLPGGARHLQAVEPVHGHGQPAAVESGLGGAAPQVRDAHVVGGGLHQVGAQPGLVPGAEPGQRRLLGRHDVEGLDDSVGAQRLALDHGRVAAGEVAEAHPVQPVLGPLRRGGVEGGVQPQALQGLRQPDGIFHPGEGTGLDAVAQPGQGAPGFGRRLGVGRRSGRGPGRAAKAAAQQDQCRAGTGQAGGAEQGYAHGRGLRQMGGILAPLKPCPPGRPCRAQAAAQAQRKRFTATAKPSTVQAATTPSPAQWPARPAPSLNTARRVLR